MHIQPQTNINFSAVTKYPRIPKKELMELVSKDYTYKQIGEMYNMPIEAVGRSFKYYGVLSSRGKVKAANIELAKDMYAQGVPKEEIRKKLRLSPSIIEKVFSEKEEHKDTLLEKLLEKLNLDRSELDIK